MKSQINDIVEAIYRQWRVNRSRNKSSMVVEVIADKRHADKFHAMLERWARSGGFPRPIKWIECEVKLLGMPYRQYLSEHGPLLGIADGLDLRVIIAEDYKCIFAIPDYQKMTYFDLTTMKMRKFPKAARMRKPVRV